MKRLVKDNTQNILEAAKWCFLNFGYSKTSMEDVAKKANVSRALIYKKFKNKDEIALDVFNILFALDRLSLKKIAAAHKPKEKRLLEMCEISTIKPWEKIAAAPMAQEFLRVCELVEPEMCAEHEEIMLETAAKILGKKELGELFVLSLEGLLSDVPSVETLRKRVNALVKIFAADKI